MVAVAATGSGSKYFPLLLWKWKIVENHVLNTQIANYCGTVTAKGSGAFLANTLNTV